jgi:hypothetical protein
VHWQHGGWRRVLVALAAASTLAGAAGMAAPSTAVAASAVVPLSARVAFSTCGFPRVQCPPSELGRTSATEPAPRTIGRFVEISLAPWILKYGADAVAPELKTGVSGTYPKRTAYANGNGPGFGGNTLPEAFFPSTGTWIVDIQGLNIPFLIPRLGLGVPSALPMSVPNLTVSVPPAHYLVIWLLETGIFGSQQADFLEHYTDGTTQYVSASFQDWCNGGSPPVNAPPQYLAIWTPYRLHPNGVKGTNVCGGFYAEFLPTLTGKVMNAITFPDIASNAFVMSMTLEKT